MVGFNNKFSKTSGFYAAVFLITLLFTSCEKFPFDWDLPKAPEITTPNIVAYDLFKIEVNADCIDDGNDPDVVKGLCWSNSQLPDTSSSKFVSGESGQGTVSTSIFWPSSQTLYIRAYAVNKTSLYYSEQVMVNWPGGSQNLPNVVLLPVQNIDFIKATIGGQIVNDGGLPITSSGICISESAPNPDISNSTVLSNQNGSTLFNFNLDNLTENITYYIRAFATNLAGTSYSSTATFTTRNYYSVGETGPAGGIVFFSKNDTLDGWQFLEAAQVDRPGTFTWSGNNQASTNVTNCSIGAGLSNTNSVVAQIGLSSSYAARSCYDYSVNSFSDWFLPSRDELLLIRTNLGLGLNSNYGLANAYYWSSSEDAGFSQNAWSVHMTSSANFSITISKGTFYKVRPIRRFK